MVNPYRNYNEFVIFVWKKEDFVFMLQEKKKSAVQENKTTVLFWNEHPSSLVLFDIPTEEHHFFGEFFKNDHTSRPTTNN